MALAIERTEFEPHEYDAFSDKLAASRRALETLLSRPGFGVGERTIGSELELSIVDQDGKAFHINRKILAEHPHPQLQLELNRFNLEFNLSPTPIAGRPFAAMREEIIRVLSMLEATATGLGGRIASIGILPTLTTADLEITALTDLPRYRALNNAIRALRQGDFAIRISGQDPLVLSWDNVTLEGANTSFQVHLRAAPDEFAALYNAAQMVTPLAAAIAANSPTFLGHRLWDETRVALFKQAVDSRAPNPREWRRAARVPFGHGWVRRGAYELFAETIALYPPLLPVLDEEDPAAVIRRGDLPRLRELRLHQGTVWQWNRAIYDPAAGGHLRIEMRALPSGPTPIDMAANAAFLIGLTLGVAPEINRLLPGFPFRYAEYNFYRSAQSGLDAQLLWPTRGPTSPEEVSARALIRRYIAVAEDGLAAAGVDSAEIKEMMDVIMARLESGTTPARWQRRVLERLGKTQPGSEELAHMQELYIQACHSGKPVVEWSTEI